MKKRLFFMFCFIQVIAFSVQAQSNLEINNIFDKYGKQQGSVLVQLASDILSQGSKITFYKSLIVNETDQNRREIYAALQADIEGKVIISQVNKNGRLESGSYYLGNSKSKGNEYLLYKNKGNKITLVYLVGNFSPARLEQELKKLKDLFIYVNDKRIKIQ